MNKSIVPAHMKGLMVLNKDQLSAGKSVFSTGQLQRLFKPTPKEHIHQLTKGGKTFDYVEGGYVRRQLDVLFGFDWDFEVVSITRDGDAIICQGKLTGRTETAKPIVKMQFGGSTIKYKKETKTPLDIGNDYKAATTDALKKCAAEFGIARDVYYANEFVEAKIIESELSDEETLDEEAKQLNEQTRLLSEDEKEAILKDLLSLEVNEKLRCIKKATGKIVFKPEDATEGQWRNVREQIAEQRIKHTGV